MGNTNTITVLNKLVELHNDRIEGYETSLKVTDEPDLKTLFAQLVHIRTKCRHELSLEIDRLGGIPKEVISISDRFLRTWMDVSDFLAGKDHKNLLDTCEFGEDEAVCYYKAVLDNDSGYLNLEQKSMIHSQYALIKTGYDKVISLR
ncbi:MAG: PA2169 family four-helix-bundle protein, partial [Lentimicrobium sp.]|nr:PA2169 family four-helix-bundle protein [Lentimicrobium sp.]